MKNKRYFKNRHFKKRIKLKVPRAARKNIGRNYTLSCGPPFFQIKKCLNPIMFVVNPSKTQENFEFDRLRMAVCDNYLSPSRSRIRIRCCLKCHIQCCGSLTSWCVSGSGSADPCLFTNGSGSCGFHHWPSRRKQKNKKKTKRVFLHTTFWRYIYIIFKDKKSKRSHKTRWKKGFSYYFCLMIKGSGVGSGSRSIPLTDGSGSRSRRPKNMWLRIRNTGKISDSLWLSHNLIFSW